jgi:hypothetical protein
MNEMTINPFESQRAVTETAGARAMQARESAEVLALIYSARNNPRNEVAACDRIRNYFARLGLAEESQYSYQRGGTDIAGPSIRAAEAIRLGWGNIAAGWREVSRYVGPDGVGVSEVEAFAIDYETGNPESIKFPVRHWRDTKTGGYKITAERDIYELTANQAQRRKRSCILALIPGDVTAMAMDQATATLKAKADLSPEGLQKMVDAFADFGVTQAHIEKRIQRHLDAITAAQVVQLKRIWASLRDGISEPSAWFEITPTADTEGSGPAVSAADVLAARRKERQAAAVKPTPKAETTKRTVEVFLEALHKATAEETAALVLDEARGELTDDEYGVLVDAFKAQWGAPQ